MVAKRFYTLGLETSGKLKRVGVSRQNKNIWSGLSYYLEMLMFNSCTGKQYVNVHLHLSKSQGNVSCDAIICRHAGQIAMQ